MNPWYHGYQHFLIYTMQVRPMNSHLKAAIQDRKSGNEILQVFKHLKIQELNSILISISAEWNGVMIDAINKEYNNFFILFASLEDVPNYIDKVESRLKAIKEEMKQKDISVLKELESLFEKEKELNKNIMVLRKQQEMSRIILFEYKLDNLFASFHVAAKLYSNLKYCNDERCIQSISKFEDFLREAILYCVEHNRVDLISIMVKGCNVVEKPLLIYFLFGRNVVKPQIEIVNIF